MTEQLPNNKAQAWYEKIVIPTYEIGLPEKNPMFLEKRVYQGSSGVVYPHPVVEKISDHPVDKEWNAVFLENQFLKIMVLPELGGRIQMAFDKTKQRHFVYYNQVIKPALVGLAGPWISGGIEFNWPQHHRPSTFQPTDHLIEENEDGSVTVWCSEIERMFRTRGMAGFTLHPDKAYLEIKVKLYNRTNYPQTFLWWANPAVKVNDHYQSVFPPDVNAVFDHGKRAVSEFPVAKGTYYKVDYSPGTDISCYRNIPVPTSYMAITSEYDFIGGYENDTKGGLLHVANRHISPGKKQWTWGNGDFGKAWDRSLTDEDGPYIELMCGVYTDNQPDFSWLMPGEEKAFSQYFMPYRDLGIVKNATKEAMVNLEVGDHEVVLKAYTTAAYPGSKIFLHYGEESLLSDTYDFHPGTSYQRSIPMKGIILQEMLYVEIQDARGNMLVSWKPGTGSGKEIPQAASAVRAPHEIPSNEGLYMAGLHLEQYRHATYNPLDYYREALGRHDGDIRCNNAMGLWYARRGQFRQAEGHFRMAIASLTEHNPNPIDGEPYYNLGLSLLSQEKDNEAYDAFYKAIWNAACIDAGYFQIALLESKQQAWQKALASVDCSLARNQHHQKARHLKACLLRKTGKHVEPMAFIRQSLLLDRFNFGLYFEQYLLDNKEATLQSLQNMMRGNIYNYIEFALDYSAAGFYTEAIQFLEMGIGQQDPEKLNPLALYCLAWLQSRAGMQAQSMQTLEGAAKACPDYCFPNQTEISLILEWAIGMNPNDGMAHYYLGNFLYNGRIYDEAIMNWEHAATLNSRFPTVHRNLALAYYNQRGDSLLALAELEMAFFLDASDSRVLMELDQLYKKLNHEPQKRLDLLEKHPALVDQRDDLYLERINLLNVLGNHQEAYEQIMARMFHPWEGGEGRVIAQYTWCLLELAKKAIYEGHYHHAITLLLQALSCPNNLGEEKILGTRDNDIHYYLGVAYHCLTDTPKASEHWLLASQGILEPAIAMFYNDQQPDSIFYQGLSLMRLGQTQKAHQKFDALIEFGDSRKDDVVAIDYFAVSLPDLLIWDENLNLRNHQMCLYLMGLGHMGKGNQAAAFDYFTRVLAINNFHEGAIRHLRDLEIEIFELPQHDGNQ